MKRIFALWALILLLAPATASAHLATFGSWETTRAHLGTLFPRANDFLVKRKSLTDSQVAKAEAALGFQLYPEDRAPVFYIAIEKRAGKKKVLGVAVFIDPRVETSLTQGIQRLEVGIAVDTRGRIHDLKIFEYRGDLAVTQNPFLGQFKGMGLKSSFRIKPGPIVPVAGEEKVSQLVANAAYEALYLMKLALGR